MRDFWYLTKALGMALMADTISQEANKVCLEFPRAELVSTYVMGSYVYGVFKVVRDV